MLIGLFANQTQLTSPADSYLVDAQSIFHQGISNLHIALRIPSMAQSCALVRCYVRVPYVVKSVVGLLHKRLQESEMIQLLQMLFSGSSKYIEIHVNYDSLQANCFKPIYFHSIPDALLATLHCTFLPSRIPES